MTMLLVIWALLFASSNVDAFSLSVPSTRHSYPMTTSLMAQKKTIEDTLERAVKCAENYGLCNVDELLELADGTCDFIYICFARTAEIECCFDGYLQICIACV